MVAGYPGHIPFYGMQLNLCYYRLHCEVHTCQGDNALHMSVVCLASAYNLF